MTAPAEIPRPLPPLPDMAYGGSPACPKCGRHSPTWGQPPDAPQQRQCLYQGCEHRWTEPRPAQAALMARLRQRWRTP